MIMTQLLQAAFNPANIIYTTMLIIIVCYWCTVILGLLDISSLEVDCEMDADVDTDIDVEGGGSWLLSTLSFFNFGKIPFMIVLSFTTLFQWTISMLATHYLGDNSIWFALAMLLPMLLVSLVCTKIMTTPLIPVFKNMNEGEEQIDYIGLTCKVLLTDSHQKMGQAEVIFNNNPLLINVKTDSQNLKLNKNEKALIIDQEENYFIIQKLGE